MKADATEHLLLGETFVRQNGAQHYGEIIIVQYTGGCLRRVSFFSRHRNSASPKATTFKLKLFVLADQIWACIDLAISRKSLSLIAKSPKRN